MGRPRKSEVLRQQMQDTAAAAESFISGEPEKEGKTARTSFLLRPSVYDDFRILADAKGTTPSVLLDELMENYVNTHREVLDAWKEYRQVVAAAFAEKE